MAKVSEILRKNANVTQQSLIGQPVTGESGSQFEGRFGIIRDVTGEIGSLLLDVEIMQDDDTPMHTDERQRVTASESEWDMPINLGSGGAFPLGTEVVT
jgi:hypothetical protein